MSRRALPMAVAALLAGCSLIGDPPPPAERPPAAAPAGAPAQDRPAEPSVRPARSFEEVRALWVVRTTLTSEASIRAMVERAGRAGFNTLIVQVRGRGDAYYQSAWEPRAEGITGGRSFDPLALVIELAHARGMAVHAWVNTHLVWGSGPAPEDPRHIVRAHPEWLAVPQALGRELYDMGAHDPRFLEALRRYAQDNAATAEGLYTSPSDPRVQERVRSVWIDLAERYDLDGIHFDSVRFPSGSFDYSRAALQRFARWVAPRLPPDRQAELRRAAAADPYAWVEALPGPWGEFRRTQITSLVRDVYHAVKARRPELVVSAAVFAHQDDAYRSRFQEWPAWLEEGILDIAVPMAYTSDHARFRTLVEEGAAAVGGQRLWAGIGVYLNTVEGSLRQLDLARQASVAGVVLFSYDWTVGEGYRGDGPTLLEEVGAARFGAR